MFGIYSLFSPSASLSLPSSSSLPFLTILAFSEIRSSPSPSTARCVIKAPSSWALTDQFSPITVALCKIRFLIPPSQKPCGMTTPPGLTMKVCHTEAWESAKARARVSRRP